MKQSLELRELKLTIREDGSLHVSLANNDKTISIIDPEDVSTLIKWVNNALNIKR